MCAKNNIFMKIYVETRGKKLFNATIWKLFYGGLYFIDKLKFYADKTIGNSPKNNKYLFGR